MIDRWFESCSRCRKQREKGEKWHDDQHWSAGGSGFTSSFCDPCMKEDSDGCDKIMSDIVCNWIKECRLRNEKEINETTKT